VRGTITIATGAGALILVIAGCGGSSGPSAEETWASGVCTSISTWRTAVNTITTEATNALTKPGATLADVNTAIDDGVKATDELIDDLKALAPPDTPDGAQAKTEVDAFLNQAQTTLGDVKTALSKVPSDASLQEVVTQLSGLGVSLQRTIASGQQLVSSIEEIGGDIRDGFESADSCKELQSES